MKECSDIKFKKLGFKIAVCQKDSPGTLTVLAPQNRPTIETMAIKAQAKVSPYGSNCISWDPDGGENNEMIVVG